MSGDLNYNGTLQLPGYVLFLCLKSLLLLSEAVIDIVYVLVLNIQQCVYLLCSDIFQSVVLYLYRQFDVLFGSVINIY